MATFRQRALDEASAHRPVVSDADGVPVSEYFASRVFTYDKMRKYLSGQAFQAVESAVRDGVKIDRHLANEIAAGMKSWAVENGVTHYTHLFHPLTDATAEKHEAMITVKDGVAFEQFSGEALIQQEPDASSFPNGGLRNTFEARGYTAWDPSSPVFILDRTLCIPSIFVSYTGEALDMKVPNLKSMAVLDKAATRVASLFDPGVSSVRVNLGIEQEYFLVDESMYNARPDLILCNRTLLGHTSAKDQQLEDHYFGAIPKRVTEFMRDFEREAYKLGILLQTRHNEVAPNQFECAPRFSDATTAIDQNLMLMILMQRIAPKHRLRVIFHEKPFDGVNGSGKHCNWSIVTNTGVNLLSPGSTPSKNLRFLAFFSSVVKAVYDHNFLLMASVASLSNSYRLGGHEAPPAYMSVFYGSTLSRIFSAIEQMKPLEDGSKADPVSIAGSIPDILPDNTDRNRTSPFAFTGNRFEFRAVGSSVNVASSVFILNTAVAQALDSFYERTQQLLSGGYALDRAVMTVVREFTIASKDIHFEGNGYSQEWQQEAMARGLRAVSDVPEAYRALTEPESVRLFTSQGVLSEREVQARFEVLNEIYVKKLQIEARVIGDLSLNHIIPTAVRYQNLLIDNIRGMAEIFPDNWRQMCAAQMQSLEKVSRYMNRLAGDVEAIVEERKAANAVEDIPQRAALYSANVAPLMDSIRDSADHLEMIVDDELWPLPKYREMLFGI